MLSCANLASLFLVFSIMLSGAPLFAEIRNSEEEIIIGAGSSEKVDRFGTCRIVGNVGDTPFLVPANNIDEWASGPYSFLNNISTMGDMVTLASCTARLLIDDAREYMIKFSAPSPGSEDWAEVYAMSADGRYIFGAKDKYAGSYGNKRPVIFVMENDGTGNPVTIWEEQSPSQRSYRTGFISEYGTYILLARTGYNSWNWTWQLYRRDGTSYVADDVIPGAIDTRQKVSSLGANNHWLADDGSEFRTGLSIYRRSAGWSKWDVAKPVFDGVTYEHSFWSADGRYAWFVRGGSPWPWTAVLAEWDGATFTQVPGGTITSATLQLTSRPAGNSPNTLVVEGMSKDNKYVMLGRAFGAISNDHYHYTWIARWNGTEYEHAETYRAPQRKSNNSNSYYSPMRQMTQSGDAITMLISGGGFNVYHSVKEDGTYETFADPSRTLSLGLNSNKLRSAYYTDEFIMSHINNGSFAKNAGAFTIIPPVRYRE